MKTTIKLIALCSVVVGLVYSTALADDRSIPAPGDLMSQIQTAYKKVSSLRADFEQTVSQLAFARTYQASGMLRYAAGNLRWDYRAPDPQTYVVVDGNVYWIQPSERQVIQMKLSEAFESHHAVASLLGGMDELDRYFKPVRAERQDGHLRLLVHPKFENPQIAEVTLTFDASQGLVKVVEIADAFGNTNQIVLKNIEKQAQIPTEVFSDPVPSGYKLSTFGQ